MCLQLQNYKSQYVLYHCVGVSNDHFQTHERVTIFHEILYHHIPVESYILNRLQFFPTCCESIASNSLFRDIMVLYFETETD